MVLEEVLIGASADSIYQTTPNVLLLLLILVPN
jgi:hypothetical protein